MEEVLVEGKSKKGTDLITARTRQNKVLHLESHAELKSGTYAQVEVTDATYNYLVGELREVIAVPTHRKRIPVMAEQSA